MSAAQHATVFRGGARLLVGSLLLSAAGLGGLVLGFTTDRDRFYFAYLTAYNYVATTALGALLFLMICHAMRAGWPVAVQRLTEAIAGLFPLLILGFLPLVPGLRVLYPWLRTKTIEDAQARLLVEKRLGYLNERFYLGRALLFLAIWTFAFLVLRRWSLRSDRVRNAELRHKLYVASAVGLPVVALALAFASFDWGMTLTPGWVSTMYPVYYFAGGFLNAIALITVSTSATDASGLLAGITRSHYYALGRLLLAFTIFWAYAAFFQYLIIWMANRPDEGAYFLTRLSGGWRAATIALVIVHFVVPFTCLLSYRLKQTRWPLAVVASWLLVAHYLDMHWLVMPAFGRGPLFSWLDFAAFAFWAGLALAYATWLARGHHLIPIGHPALAEALAYESA